jgi:hypothetical protein
MTDLSDAAYSRRQPRYVGSVVHVYNPNDASSCFADYIRNIFSRYCQVKVTNNGQTALEMARKMSPVLIISDVMMPGWFILFSPQACLVTFYSSGWLRTSQCYEGGSRSENHPYHIVDCPCGGFQSSRRNCKLTLRFELAFGLMFPCNSSPEPMVSAGCNPQYRLINPNSIADYLSKPFSSKELLARANFQIQLGKRRREMEARFQSVDRCIRR